MEGLLLRLLPHRSGHPEPSFWQLFAPVRNDLDRLFWCFGNPPWMAAPDEFLEDEFALMAFEGEERTSVQLWRPGSLSRYADQFTEEYIDLWGIEPTPEQPQRLAAISSASPWQKMDKVIQNHARVWLRYTDSTCWEIYARASSLLSRLRKGLNQQAEVAVYESRSDRRASGFRAAGLSEVWAALNGRFA